ncbi:MAG: hypothetical protein AAF439_03565 [Pseudomonadota bacterium]
MIWRLALAGLLTACAPVQSPQPTNSDVGALQAIGLFQEVCLATAPEFLAAERRMAAGGLTVATSAGALEDPSGALSAKVQDRAGRNGISVRRCSIVFDDTDYAGALEELVEILQTNDLQTSPPQRALIGSREVTVWDIRIGGRAGRVTLIPAKSRALRGGVYLDIPQTVGAA